jgi:diacylglycerol kinase (ATP)
MLMNKPGKRGVARAIAATRYSLQGLRAAWHHEEAFRLEALLVAVAIPLAFWIGDGLTHQLLLVLSCGQVLIAELVNSAIEAVVDRISFEQHPLAGRAKDIGSAAVFVSLGIFGIVWGLSVWEWWLR